MSKENIFFKLIVFKAVIVIFCILLQRDSSTGPSCITAACINTKYCDQFTYNIKTLLPTLKKQCRVPVDTFQKKITRTFPSHYSENIKILFLSLLFIIIKIERRITRLYTSE